MTWYKPFTSLLPLALKNEVYHLVQRGLAVGTSLRSQEDARGSSVLRFKGYQAMKALAREMDRPGLRVIEFGGSNGIIKSFFPQADYVVAPNYPEVDIQNLSAFAEASCDVVVLDQILEHVENPFQAVKEIHRILCPGGALLGATPFLLYLHPFPRDYWRFTADGLRVLLKDFSKIQIQSWGNRIALDLINIHGMGVSISTARKVCRLLWDNEPNFPLIYWFVAIK